jgi:hypothetical protein
MEEKFRRREGWPRSGWTLLSTTDNETASFECENCGYPHVRYEHELRHEKTKQRVRVGCVCAEHLTQDFVTPKLRERGLKSRAGRRMRWPTLNWRLSGKGNLYLKKSGMVIVLKQGPLGGWAASYKPKDALDHEWVHLTAWHDTASAAKLAAFDSLYPPSA